VLNFIKKRAEQTRPLDGGAYVVAPGKRVFNDARAQTEVRSANVMRLAYAAFAIAALAIVWAICASNNQRPVPHVILVQNNGRSLAVLPIKDDPTLRDVVVTKQLTNMVHALFTRTGSYTADQFNLKGDVSPLLVTSDPSYTTVNSYLANPDNNLKLATTLASVEIETPLKRANDSWYIKWVVTITNPDGRHISSKNFDVTAVTKFRNLDTVLAQDANPTGLEVVAFPFQTFSGGTGQ